MEVKIFLSTAENSDVKMKLPVSFQKKHIDGVNKNKYGTWKFGT